MPWWEHEIPADDRVKVGVDKLSFDRDNPRFTPEKRPASNSDAAFIAELAASADLGELIDSISTSGYIDIEPLIVIGRDDELVVIEGNRRLAALKALRSADLARQAKLSVPTLSDAVRKSLEEVSVYRVVSQDQARTLIGFKHINGPQAWDAHAKGIYAARWLDDERQKRVNTGSGMSLGQIAKSMGDKNDTIHRLVSAIYVLDQAEAAGIFSVADRATKNFSFSHLYTALTYVEYREFLGMPAQERTTDPIRDPVPISHLSSLAQLLRWLYGQKSEAVEPAITRQNPDIARLKKVLGDPIAQRVMLERGDLSGAEVSTLPASSRFEEHLVKANENLRTAQTFLDGYDGTDKTLLAIAQQVHAKARTIYRSMELEASGRGKDDLFGPLGFKGSEPDAGNTE
ncbi:ParB N-terminal domain-containing protein [Mesorhizobium sp. M0644]